MQLILGVLICEPLLRNNPFYDDISLMDAMTNKYEVEFPQDFDPEASSCLIALIEKNSWKRFSYKDIQKHHWSNGSRREEVMVTKIILCYLSVACESSDVHNFDKKYTKEPAIDSVCLLSVEMDCPFAGFY